MSSSHPRLRRLMEENHAFLYKLYTQKDGRKNRTTLRRAKEGEVFVVLRLLFCIAVGHIPLTKANYKKLVHSKRRNNLRSLKNRMRQLKRSSLEEQRKFILQFAALYPYLFYDIFNES